MANQHKSISSSHEDDEPLKDDEIYEYVEIEIDDPNQETEVVDPNREFPDWAYRDGNVKKRRKKRQKIKVRKKVKVKKKKSSRKYKKLFEKIFWILVVGGFIATLVLLVRELDIFKDKRNLPRGKSFLKTDQKKYFTENSHLQQSAFTACDNLIQAGKSIRKT